MSHIKTIIFFFVFLGCITSFAESQKARDCFNQIMNKEGIAKMPNRFNSNTSAGKVALNIWQHCTKLHKASTNAMSPYDADPEESLPAIETLECALESCPGSNETRNTEVEI